MPLLLLLFFQPAWGLSLSQDYVIKRALSSSLHIQKIQLKKQQAISRLEEQKHALYDWKTFAGVQKNQRKNPQTFPFEALEQKDRLFNLGLEKQLPLGFRFKTLYTDFSQDRVNNEVLNRVQAPGFIYKENLSLELNMDLMGNFLGREERILFGMIKAGQTRADWSALETAEQLALKAAQQYWASYRAWVAFQQMKQGLKTYQQMVREIKNKKRYNFLKPGEAPQVFAEYENLKQEVSRKEQLYRDELEGLFVILKIKPEWKSISFQKEKVSAPPVFKPVQSQNTRSMKIIKEQIKEQELQVKKARSAFLPKVQFQSKTGLLSGGNTSDREDLFSQNKYFYELSLNVLYNPFSKSVREKAKLEKYKLEESKIDLEILNQELENLIASLQRRIQVAHTNFLSAEKAGEYQKEAFKELKKSFSQGRADIFDLIRTENKLRESVMRKTALLSEYHLLTMQLKAVSDQLVENYLPKDSQ